MDGKHVVFGEVLTGKSVVRRIENLTTQGGDKPAQDVVITDCGEISSEEAHAADPKRVDSTGDTYEDFPEDAKPENQEFTAEQIAEIASKIKEFGNTAFKAGNLQLGLEKYQKGLRYLNEEPELKDASEEVKKQLTELRFSLNSNSALISNKLKAFDDAAKSATFALEVPGISHTEKAKALYRRAVAEVGLKDEDSALKDLEEAVGLVPGDAAITKELATVKKAVADRARKEKAAYSKFFTS